MSGFRLASGPRMNDCQGKLPPHAKEGLRLFNAGEYFEAHEALELAWREETGQVRRLYQGILETAVTYLRIQRGNYVGAVKVYDRSRKWLRDWPDVCCGVNVGKVYDRSRKWLRMWPDICCGVNVGKLRADLDQVIAEVQRLGPEHIAEFDQSLLKPVEWTED